MSRLFFFLVPGTGHPRALLERPVLIRLPCSCPFSASFLFVKELAEVFQMGFLLVDDGLVASKVDWLGSCRLVGTDKEKGKNRREILTACIFRARDQDARAVCILRKVLTSY